MARRLLRDRNERRLLNKPRPLNEPRPSGRAVERKRGDQTLSKPSLASTVAAVVEAMEQIAPTWAAEEWDNVGLLVGDQGWPARRILLTIDLTAAVLDEARRGKFDLIVAYHPPIFRPVKRMRTDGADQSATAARAVAERIAIYSPHTALDAAPGGTNDTLAALCGLEGVTPASVAGAAGRQCKLVVFVPPSDADRLAEAIFEAGAGRIGDYEKCSFRLRGEGTFFGTEAAAPVVGRKGRLERVDEIRLEVVLPRQRLAAVTTALRKTHPYEEPAFDVYPLEPTLDRRIGQGRIGRFARTVTLSALARSLVGRTGATSAVTVGEGRRKLRRALVWVGAAGKSPIEALDRQADPPDVVITGELSHHEALHYLRQGLAAIALGHWASERPVLKPLSVRLSQLLPKVRVVVSRLDRDPFQSV